MYCLPITGKGSCRDTTRIDYACPHHDLGTFVPSTCDDPRSNRDDTCAAVYVDWYAQCAANVKGISASVAAQLKTFNGKCNKVLKRVCKTVVNGKCGSCLDPVLDPKSACVSCVVQSRDAKSKCTKCLPGFFDFKNTCWPPSYKLFDGAKDSFGARTYRVYKIMRSCLTCKPTLKNGAPVYKAQKGWTGTCSVKYYSRRRSYYSRRRSYGYYGPTSNAHCTQPAYLFKEIVSASTGQWYNENKATSGSFWMVARNSYTQYVNAGAGYTPSFLFGAMGCKGFTPDSPGCAWRKCNGKGLVGKGNRRHASNCYHFGSSLDKKNSLWGTANNTVTMEVPDINGGPNGGSNGGAGGH
eukprot:COSAG01_NODE_4471_length_4996_cov_2.220339_3_plen_353_part_00